MPLTAADPHSQEFLAGANNIDEHFKNQPYQDNLPVLMGLTSLWNVSFLGHGAKAILPYCQVQHAGYRRGLGRSNVIVWAAWPNLKGYISKTYCGLCRTIHMPDGRM